MADYIKLPEVARRLDISEKTARRMVKAGKLPALFIGNAYRVREEDLEEYLQSAKVEPGKAPRRSPSEPSLNDALEDERREAIYGPWLEFVNRYADRWEQRIAAGDFDWGAFNEFNATFEDLALTLSRLGLQEQREQPPRAIMDEAMMRLQDLLDPLLEAAVAKFEGSELEQLRRRREAMQRSLERSA